MPKRPAIVAHGGAGRAVSETSAARLAAVRTATERGWECLAAGGTALDAVVAAVVEMESDPALNAGLGSVLNGDGAVEMDASLMNGRDLAAGAVAAVSAVRHPILLARAILEHGRHVFLVGEAAHARAREWGLETCEPGELVTPRQRRRWLERPAAGGDGGTVGAVAVDAHGSVAAATSTGGMFGKWPGRVGDSAVIGAGTYADDRSGAASATGHGEAIIRVTLSRLATLRLEDGGAPERAAASAIRDLARRIDGEAGLVLVDPHGRVGWASNAESMPLAWRNGDAAAVEALDAGSGVASPGVES